MRRSPRHNAMIFVLFALLALTAAMASAQSGDDQRPSHAPEHGFHSLDADGDGQITREEYEAVDHFALRDRNGDGVLNSDDRSERGDMRRRMRHRGPSGSMAAMILAFRADADEDRVTTISEWQNYVAALDADFNGEIDQDEWVAALAPPDREREIDPERFDMLVSRLDDNENGVIDTTEVDAIFAKLDDDGDGEVVLERRRGRGRGRG